MFENELQDLRRFQWRVDTSTRAIFTADDAREFLHNVGFCLEYPLRSPVLAPTFIGAVIGSDQNLPTAKYAFIHPRAKEATEFKDRLLREKSAFEAGFGDDDNLLISAAEFPYFYSLIGERNPKVPPSAGERGERALLKHTFELIQEHGPILETDLRERLGESVSDVALSRTLSELRQKLRIVRIEDEGGPNWDLLMRWAPQVVNQGKQISAQEALSALVGKYLETCVAAEQKDIEEFFGYLVPRSRVAEVIKALLGAREFSFIQINGKNLLRNSPRISAEERAAQIAAAAAPKPEGRANRSFRAHEASAGRPLPEGDAMPTKKNVWEKYGPKADKFKHDRFEKGDQREARPWKKSAGDAPAPFARKREWKPESGPRPGSDRPERSGGRFEEADRSFRPAGDRPPKRFGAGEKREWTPRAGDASAPREGGVEAWKPREGGAGSFGPKKFGAKKFGPKKFGAKKFGARPGTDRPRPDGPRKEWKPREAGADTSAPRREWKDRPAGGKPDFKKFGDKKFGKPSLAKKPFGQKTFGPKSSAIFDRKFGAKKPWEKKASEASEGAPSAEGSSGAPSSTVPDARAPFKKSFKKAGQAGGGFKKPFKKDFKPRKSGSSFAKPGGKTGRPFKKSGPSAGGFKKSFKKPFKKAGPGGTKPSRRPA